MAQPLQKSFAGLPQSFLKPFRANAIAARPRLGSILVPAIFSRVGVPHADQVKILFPIRPFFIERRRAKTGFNPMHRSILTDTRLRHVVQVFVARNGAFAERSVHNRLPKNFFPPGLDSRFHQVTHGRKIPNPGRIANRTHSRNLIFNDTDSKQIPKLEWVARATRLFRPASGRTERGQRWNWKQTYGKVRALSHSERQASRLP